jgi:deferrochelatase/peroxidase EfeB
MLASLQSNIIRPHVRSELRLLALRIDDPVGARRGLAAIAHGLKSAAAQIEELRAFREAGTPGTPFVGVGLSASGYARLGVDPRHWPRDPAFRAGMQHRDLGDPAPGAWGAPYREGLDVLVAVGSHDAALTERAVQEVLGALDASVRLLVEETACTLTNAAGDGIEHFGYLDGRSQPLFVDEDLDGERATGIDHWNPLVPLSHVLVADPGAPQHDHAFGSYLVYRKLEQHVRAFKEQEARLAAGLGLSGEDAERAGALLVGRFEDGTPLALSGTGGMRPVPNDFDYADDPGGARCPPGAHVRTVNARIGDPAKRVVIARRGQSYGQRTDDPNGADLSDKPNGGVGLLFLAVVAGLETQFEAVQRAANGEDGAPVDAIMGQRAGSSARLATRWDDPAAPVVPLAVEPVVTLLGGEYCFLPSIDFLRGLGDD